MKSLKGATEWTVLCHCLFNCFPSWLWITVMNLCTPHVEKKGKEVFCSLWPLYISYFSSQQTWLNGTTSISFSVGLGFEPKCVFHSLHYCFVVSYNHNQVSDAQCITRGSIQRASLRMLTFQVNPNSNMAALSDLEPFEKVPRHSHRSPLKTPRSWNAMVGFVWNV